MHNELIVSNFRRPQWSVIYKYFGAKLRGALTIYMEKGDNVPLNAVISSMSDFAFILEADNRAFRKPVFFTSCIVAADFQGTFGLKPEEATQIRTLLHASFIKANDASDLGPCLDDIVGRAGAPVHHRQSDNMRFLTDMVATGATVRVDGDTIHVTVGTREQYNNAVVVAGRSGMAGRVVINVEAITEKEVVEYEDGPSTDEQIEDAINDATTTIEDEILNATTLVKPVRGPGGRFVKRTD